LARHWIQPTGQLLLDSTDLSDAGNPADLEDLPAERESENWESPSGKLAAPAHLEAGGSEDWQEGSEAKAKVVNFVAEYNGQRGDPFPWLFVDPETLLQCAHANGWQGQIVYQEPEGAFLARLTPF
jgi:hypothetical protein